MTKHAKLKIMAGVLVALALALFLLHAIFAPKFLRVAVGPIGSSDMRVVVAFLQTLQRERAGVRLKLVLTDGPAASAKAIEEKKADLAVIRPDIALPEQSATVAILRREAVYFVTKPGAKIERITELRGKSVAIVGQRASNEAMLEKVLSTYGLAMKDVTIVRGGRQEILQAVQEGQLDAVFMVAPTSDRMTRQFFQAFPKAGEAGAEFLAITEAEAIAEQFPALDTVELVRGALGADPPQPDEETTTLAATHRLVARRSLDESVVSELTRLLFSLRLAIAAEAPAANQIEVPSVENRGSKLPIHPGTIAYIEGETRSFFDRYGDWLWFGIMGISLAGSAVAALFSNFGHRHREDDPAILFSRVLRITQSARRDKDADAFHVAISESEAVSDIVLSSLAKGRMEPDKVAAMSLLLAEMHRVIDERRAALSRPGQPAAAE